MISIINRIVLASHVAISIMFDDLWGFIIYLIPKDKILYVCRIMSLSLMMPILSHFIGHFQYSGAFSFPINIQMLLIFVVWDD